MKKVNNTIKTTFVQAVADGRDFNRLAHMTEFQLLAFRQDGSLYDYRTGEIGEVLEDGKAVLKIRMKDGRWYHGADKNNWREIK